MWLESFQPGFPIQISSDRGIFAPPRSFSQLITSFFGSQCQGIHPTLFFLDHSGFRQLTKTIALVFGLVIFFVFVRCIMLCFRNSLHLGCLVIVLTFISSMCSFQGPFELFVLFAISYIAVEITRFELVTPCLQGRCSPNWAKPPFDLAATCSPIPSPV